jgi:hypothetical protein
VLKRNGSTSPQYRRSGIVAALIARVCSEASAAGAKFVQGGGGDGPHGFMNGWPLVSPIGPATFPERPSRFSQRSTACLFARSYAAYRPKNWGDNRRMSSQPRRSRAARKTYKAVAADRDKSV